MTPRLPHCLILGNRSTRPFCGSFQIELTRGEIQLNIAGRIGSTLSPEEALTLLTRVQCALTEADGIDCLAVIRSCWEALFIVPRRELGPAQGGDLSLLIVAQDAQRCALSAIGLDALWEVDGNDVRKIAGPQTAETNHPGLPEKTPKALELPPSNRRFVATCRGDGDEFPGLKDTLIARGERP